MSVTLVLVLGFHSNLKREEKKSGWECGVFALPDFVSKIRSERIIGNFLS